MLSTRSVEKSSAPEPLILEVALDTPLRQVFDYLPVPGEPQPEPGMRVLVPFGRRQMVGVIVSLKDRSERETAQLKRVLRLIDPLPTFDPPLLKLLRWAADYYHHPLGEALAAALPKLAREGAPLQASIESWQLTALGETALAAGEPRRAPRQRALLEALAQHPGAGSSMGMEAARLDDDLPGWREAARALRTRGWIERLDGPRAPDVAQATTPDTEARPRPTPTPAQQAALEAIRAHHRGEYRAWLLHGVTGSGKTEVYLRLAEDALAAGRSVLVLVPEIGLTPQLVGRFAARFAGTSLAVLHSGLTDGARLAAWRRAESGEARLVIGTRSAIFAPVPALGLILVDEEHDASFKQQEGGFRYSARDLALARAHGLGIPVVLGSATPSLETLHNAATGRMTRLSLPERAADARPPRLRLIDLRDERVHAGLATTSVTAIERHLAAV
jgi:primosomal protein N' (replication factor Y)